MFLEPSPPPDFMIAASFAPTGLSAELLSRAGLHVRTRGKTVHGSLSVGFEHCSKQLDGLLPTLFNLDLIFLKP